MSDYDRLTSFGWTTPEPELHHKYTIPTILELLPKGNPLYILDIGCGNGYLVNFLSNCGHKVMGVDIAEDGIKIARNAYPHLRFELRSAYNRLDDLWNEGVDVVISSEVIEHLYYPHRFLRNFYKVLRSGGYLILTTPYHGYLKNLAISVLNGWDKHHDSGREGGHIKFFSEDSLARILTQNGFSEIIYKNSGRIPFFWKSMVCRAQKPLDTIE